MKTSQSTPPTVVGTPVYPSADGIEVPAPEDDADTLETLEKRGWPLGLAATLSNSVKAFPLRFVVVDNSGSMDSYDGSMLRNGQLRRCTRWVELREVCLEMAEVALVCRAPTHFHFLNASTQGKFVAVADDGSTVLGTRRGASLGMNALKRAMDTEPYGTTPLTESVREITELIRPLKSHLEQRGQQCVVVLATDGLPNDKRSFLQALQELQRLPVWIVVRLCTDEDSIVDYWSDLDHHLERPLETLDDLASEAQEVGRMNPWLAYAPALHVARTMGLRHKVFDLIDERPLRAMQVKQLVENLWGFTGLPEPELDLGDFVQEVERRQAELPKVFNPRAGKMTPWVDAQRLSYSLSSNTLCVALARCLS